MLDGLTLGAKLHLLRSSHKSLLQQRSISFRKRALGGFILFASSVRLKQHSFRRRPLGDDRVATISIVDECLLFNDQLMTDEWPLFDRLTEWRYHRYSFGKHPQIYSGATLHVTAVEVDEWRLARRSVDRLISRLAPDEVWVMGFFQYRIFRCYGFVWTYEHKEHALR